MDFILGVVVFLVLSALPGVLIVWLFAPHKSDDGDAKGVDTLAVAVSISTGLFLLWWASTHITISGPN
ncbi:hypothetical protein [Streptacidiphilus albus]|uniref:hypothetical protein n=1 Tax=Streptacidiphilus albus TaxID=105425 RepID=UPI00054C7C2E|nr:hypothetical protein [Streptacidiphilus albus]